MFHGQSRSGATPWDAANILPEPIGSRLGRPGGLMRGDGAQKYPAKVLELGRAHAIDVRKGVQIARAARRHISQGAIGKNHIGRHLALFGEAQAQGFQRRQQRRIGIRRGVAIVRTRLAARSGARRFGSIQEDGFAAIQRAAFFRDGKAAMTLQVQNEKSARDKLADQ